MIKKRVAVFSVAYFIAIFTIGLNFFKSLDQVISSGELSEEGIVLRILNEGSADASNTFWGLVT